MSQHDFNSKEENTMLIDEELAKRLSTEQENGCRWHEVNDDTGL